MQGLATSGISLVLFEHFVFAPCHQLPCRLVSLGRTHEGEGLGKFRVERVMEKHCVLQNIKGADAHLNNVLEIVESVLEKLGMGAFEDLLCHLPCN